MKKSSFISLLLLAVLCLFIANPAMAKKVYPKVNTPKGLRLKDVSKYLKTRNK